MPEPRRFYLHRDQDYSGMSGTGRVADGVCWPDGTVTVRWRGERPSTVHWSAMADAEAIHGHGGATRIVWLELAEVDDEQDRYYLDLKGSRERLCRASTGAPPETAALLNEAIDRIDQLGSALPQWSTRNMPYVEEASMAKLKEAPKSRRPTERQAATGGAGLGGALTGLVLWVLSHWRDPVPAQVEGAVVVLVPMLVAWVGAWLARYMSREPDSPEGITPPG